MSAKVWLIIDRASIAGPADLLPVPGAAVAPLAPMLCQAWLCPVSTVEISIGILAGNVNNLLEMQVSEL
ncbi:hypothetical protein QT971_10245 [Microcoleus sp. herbarium19]|uniref:hypothetical protein n=1 Tax=unclassified Microcoleus TaxID=2642155 RepID=UPI002FD2FB04